MSRTHIWSSPLSFQPINQLHGGIAPQDLAGINIPGFSGTAAAATVTSFMMATLRLLQNGDVGAALVNLTRAHALMPVDNTMSVSAEMVTVCTTLVQDTANIPVLARNPQFLRMLVHNYGQKRLDTLISGLILPQLCTYTQTVCGNDEFPCGRDCEFQRFAAERATFVPFTTRLPVDDAGRPVIMVPGAVVELRPRHTARGLLQLAGLAADGDVQRMAVAEAAGNGNLLRRYLLDGDVQ